MTSSTLLNLDADLLDPSRDGKLMADIAVPALVQYKDVTPPAAGQHPTVLNCRKNGYNTR